MHLADTKKIRSRVVYDLITLVSEVSGFNDLFVVGFGFIFSFYTPVLLGVSLVKHTSPVELPHSKNKKKKKIAQSLTHLPESLC